MSDARVLADAPWLSSGPAARVLDLLNGEGEEARWSAARSATPCLGFRSAISTSPQRHCPPK